MNIFRIIVGLMILSAAISCSDDKSSENEGENQIAMESVTEQDLARKLGADEWGMRKYVMVFLKSGPNRGQDSTEAAKLQEAHMDNISRLAEEGKLILAGPFLDDGKLRGLYLFDVETVEEARALTETDPAIKAGRLEMEMHPWYGSAALMKVNEIHEQITKKN